MLAGILRARRFQLRVLEYAAGVYPRSYRTDMQSVDRHQAQSLLVVVRTLTLLQIFCANAVWHRAFIGKDPADDD
jgi:hypothetical protein